MKKSKRKLFVIDTCVLLYDRASIHSFPGNDLIIPLVVLDELDRFKDRKGIIGENARYVNRYLDNLRQKGQIHLGIELDNKQTIKVELSGTTNVPVGLDPELADNKIISLAHKLHNSLKQSVIVVTKDINFRVKCDALGIAAEDYYKDKVIESSEEIYRGFVEISGEKVFINSLYEDVSDLSDVEELFGRKLYENEFFCIKNKSQSFLGYKHGKEIIKVLPTEKTLDDLMGVKARNREQLYALNLLCNEDVPLVSLAGVAGSGKTFLTLMTAIDALNKQKYERIVISRNIQPVGRDIGFLPGDVNEKMAPWLAPIMDNFRHGLKDKNLMYFKAMRDKGQIEVAPLSFIRGRTFSNTFLILDEAQNASIHELKTVITRMGEGSKIVLLGDIDQIDTPYLDSLSNGLTIVAEKFKNSKLAGHVLLTKGERSSLATIASQII
ncbi:MAG: PhoH family protein [Rhodospirillaceae bacterium]|nr:PhoH family protein [Rhodospirillaceae bacterium]